MPGRHLFPSQDTHIIEDLFLHRTSCQFEWTSEPVNTKPHTSLQHEYARNTSTPLKKLLVQFYHLTIQVLTNDFHQLVRVLRIFAFFAPQEGCEMLQAKGLPYPLRSKERFHAIAKLFQHISSPAIETQTDTCEADWNPRQSIPTQKKTCNHRHIFSIPLPPCSNSVDPKLKMPCPNPWNHQRWKTQILRFPAHSKSPLPGRWWPFPELCLWGFHPFLRKATKMACNNSMLRQVSFRRRVMANFPLASLEVSQNHTGFFTDPRSTGVHKVALIPWPTSEEHHWLANKEPLHLLDITHAVFYIFKIIYIYVVNKSNTLHMPRNTIV